MEQHLANLPKYFKDFLPLFLICSKNKQRDKIAKLNAKSDARKTKSDRD